MPAVDPGADGRGADLDQARGFMRVHDGVVVLGSDAVAGTQFHAVPVLTTGLAGRLAPIRDGIESSERLVGVEEVGRAVLPDWDEVAAGDPATHRSGRGARQLGDIARRDLCLVAQIIDWVVPLIADPGSLLRERAWSRAALESKAPSGQRFGRWQRWPRGRGLAFGINGRWLRVGRSLGNVASGYRLRDGAQVRRNPLTIRAKESDEVT
jgi:hypothetical protein